MASAGNAARLDAAVRRSPGCRDRAFHEVTPLWLPRNQADVRAAWEGPFPDMPGMTLRVEAAAYHGRPVFFNVVAPWTRPTRNMAPPGGVDRHHVATHRQRHRRADHVASAFLARRHLRSGRGDRRGAFRTAAIMFVVAVVAGCCCGAALRACSTSSTDRVTDLLGVALFSATLHLAALHGVRAVRPAVLADSC